MPNHVHGVLQPLPKTQDRKSCLDYADYHKLEDITGSIKKFSSRRINSVLDRTGSFWKEESFDRIVRGELDLVTLIDYIHGNPVRWKLVQRPEQYRWSSASTIYSGNIKYAGWFDF